MSKGEISNKKLSESKNVEEAQVWRTLYDYISQADFERERLMWIAHSVRSPIQAILNELEHVRLHGKSKKWLRELELQAWLSAVKVSHYGSPKSYTTAIEDRLKQLEKVTLGHSLSLEKLEADVEELKGEVQEGEEQKWPAYTSEEFGKIVENSEGLENAGEDKSQILYHIMEIEALLGRIEKKAGVTGREAEARLAASLRDICRVHEPSELSDEQIKCFTGSLRALIEGWGQLNREKVKWIRSRLLKVGLTWLPVTKKAEKDIAEAKKAAGIDEQ